jgi:D-alanine-D-alanine ligase
MRVAVLMGGRSSEREISLRTGRGIAQALRNNGHEVLPVDAAHGRLLPAGNEEQGAMPASEVKLLPASSESAIASAEALNQADVVFVALHGGAGEDGTVQALLELTDKPYTGSGVMASAIAMDKAMSKRLFEYEGIPTPRWTLLSANAAPRELDVAALGGYPLVVKPNADGSSLGLTIVTSADALPAALDLAAQYGDVLIEQFIPGRELTVAVIGEEPLPIVEIRPRSGNYDYASKYTAGASEYFCPADLPADVTRHIQQLSLAACRVLDTAGVARVDFRLAPDGTPHCLEVNTIPGMTATSLVPMAAKAVGMSFEELCERIARLGLERAARESRPPLPRPAPSS